MDRDTWEFVFAADDRPSPWTAILWDFVFAADDRPSSWTAILWDFVFAADDLSAIVPENQNDTFRSRQDDGDLRLLSLTGDKDESECDEAVGVAPKSVRVTYFPRRRRTWVNLCLIVTALLVLGTGIIAAIFLYRHFSNKVVRGHFGVTYYDKFYHQLSDQLADPTPTPARVNSRPQIRMDFFEEVIDVSVVDMYERLEIPRFDEVKDTNVIWHDTKMNLTAIVYSSHRTCYVMEMNASRIAPPRDLIDYLSKAKTGNYMINVTVVREDYRLMLPPVKDLTVFGSIILRECHFYYTYRLEKFVPGVYKRSAEDTPVLVDHLGYFSWMPNKKDSHIYKMDVYGPRSALDRINNSGPGPL